MTSGDIVIRVDGVGPVRLGDNITIPNVLNRSKLPSSYPHLYDKLTCDRNQFSGEFELVGVLDGDVSLIVLSDDEDRVCCFAVTTPNVISADGLSIKSSPEEIIASGAKVEKQELYDNNSVIGYEFCLVNNGLYYLFQNTDFSANGINADAHPIAIANTRHFLLSDYLPISLFVH